MPVRAKRNKRRATASAPQWEMVFASGYDHFDELPEVGVTTDAYGKPARDQAEQAWRRFGDAFLASYEDPYLTPWALEQFGAP